MMKNLFAILTIALTLVLSGCQDEIPQSDPNESQDVTFSIGTTDGGLLKSEPDCSMNADYVLAFIEIDGETQNIRLPIFYVNEVLYTQAIKLAPGNYMLEEFVLCNNSGTPEDYSDDIVVSASPHAGSEYGELIPNSLDLSFNVSAFTKSEISLNVFCYERTKAKNFGFTWFQPQITVVKEGLFFGDFCSSEYQVYGDPNSKYSEYGVAPLVDLPAIFKIDLFFDQDGDSEYETALGTYLNDVDSDGVAIYSQRPEGVHVPPMSVPYIDQPEVDDYFKMDVYIYELISIDENTGEKVFDYKYFESWYFTNDADVMYKEVTYRNDPTSLESVGPGTDGVYDFVVGPCVVIEWDIDVNDPDYGNEVTNETAYAKGDPSSCFIELGFSRWGWTNELDNEEGNTYELPIWAAAGQCDTDKGMHVGTLTIEILSGNSATITYSTFAGFYLEETQLYVGKKILPTKDHKQTVASGQFPYKNENLSGETSDSYTVELPDDNSFYLVAHAVVSGMY